MRIVLQLDDDECVGWFLLSVNDVVECVGTTII